MTSHHNVVALSLLGLLGCLPARPTTGPAPLETAADQPALAPGQPAAFPEEPFRAKAPEAGPERPFKLPPVHRFAMGPAIDVYLIEDHDLPIVSLDLNLAGGSMNDPAGKVGLASLCMNMLTEGTRRLDKIAYSEALADIASRISSYAGDDRQGLSMSSLKRYFGPTFALYVETITLPGFRQSDFDRMVKRSLDSLKQAKASPGSVGARVGGPVLYGLRHPLGRVVTEATLGKLSLADCTRYHAAYVKPKAARLFVTGDITEAEIREAFEPVFATWKGQPRQSVAMPRPAAPSGKIFFVHIPGAAQSQVSLVHLGPPRTSPHYLANTMMGQVLGGGFASRINMNLREDKGYSYGARAGFSYNKFFGRFGASSSVRTDATAQSVLELVAEVTALKTASRPPTDVELAREKNGEILGLPASFATGSSTLGMYRGLAYYGLPLDYYNTYVESVNSVSAEAVSAAAQRELKPEAAHILVVGDGDALQIAYDPSAKDSKVSPPMLGKDGKQLTLRQALAELLAAGKVGRGKLVELDADGRIMK